MAVVLVVHESRVRDEHGDLFGSSYRDLRAQVEAIVERGVGRGLFSTTDPRATSRLVVRLVLAGLREHALDRTRPTISEREATMSFVLRGLS